MSDPENPYAAPLAADAPPLEPQKADFVPASQGKRFANLLIDSMAMFVFLFVIGMVLAMVGGADPDEPSSRLLDYLINILIGTTYYTLLEGFTGKSLGKLITGTKVVDANGNPPTFGIALLRSICRYIPFEPFSFLSSDARGWHDSITKTWVVNSR